MITPLVTVESSTFSTLLNENELLQIKGSNVSIISTRSGFCEHFYYLPHQPRQFSFSASFPERYALVYPNSKEKSELLVVLETYTGKVLRSIQMKSGMLFTRVSIGTHVVFQETSNLNRIYYSSPSQNEAVNFYDLKSKAVVIASNKSLPQFVVYTDSNTLSVVGLQPEVQVLSTKPFSEKFSFIHFSGSFITIGLNDGRLQIINTENDSDRTVDTPHRTSPIYYSDGIAITRDGTAFSIDTGETFLIHFKPESVSRGGTTLAIIGKNQTKLYEFIKKPVCSCLQFQPPEPFVSSTFCIEDLILFAAGSHIYSFDFNNITKFATLYTAKSIIKILNSSSLITVVYISNEGVKRIQTLVSGANKRDEEGIDAATDTNKQTWILEKNRIVAFRKNLLAIEEVKTIDLPENHQYDSIFRMRNSVGLYSSQEGHAAFINGDQLIEFRLPRKAVIFAWPAICTSQSIFIYKRENDHNRNRQQANEIRSEDFECITVSVSSCCWLGYTLFAVEGSKVISINRRFEKRSILHLPNNMCHLTAALPSQLIFVSTIPELCVVVEKRPLIFSIINDLDSDPDFRSLPFVLDHLPHLPIDPATLSITNRRALMSIYSKCPLSQVTPTVIDVYSRFGRFNEIRSMVKNDPKLEKLVADSAEKFGQFEIARQIYDEIEDINGLLTIFMVCKHAPNLIALANKFPFLAPAVQKFLQRQVPRQPDPVFAPLENLKLPKCKELIRPEPFEIAAGEDAENSSVPLHMPAFDEPSDFGLYIHKMSNDEIQEIEEQQAEAASAEQQQQQQSEQPEGEKAVDGQIDKGDDKQQEQPEVRQNPEHSFTEERLKFDDFFNEEEDEMFKKDEVKRPVLQFNFKPRKSLVPNAMANRFSLNPMKPPNLAADDSDLEPTKKKKIQFSMEATSINTSASTSLAAPPAIKESPEKLQPSARTPFGGLGQSTPVSMNYRKSLAITNAERFSFSIDGENESPSSQTPQRRIRFNSAMPGQKMPPLVQTQSDNNSTDNDSKEGDSNNAGSTDDDVAKNYTSSIFNDI